jgi:hypothetical protein
MQNDKHAMYQTYYSLCYWAVIYQVYTNLTSYTK